MKKLLNLSFLYFVFAMIGGVFYREFTKHMRFTGETTLSLIHVHLLVLGTLFFLLLLLFCKHTQLQENKKFKLFLILYNIGLPLMVIMLTIRGVLQVLQSEITSSINGAISGIAGLSHIIMAVAFLLFFSLLKVEVSQWDTK